MYCREKLYIYVSDSIVRKYNNQNWQSLLYFTFQVVRMIMSSASNLSQALLTLIMIRLTPLHTTPNHPCQGKAPIFHSTSIQVTLNVIRTDADTFDRKYMTYHVDGLVQDCSNSSALAMELLQSCTKPSMYSIIRSSGDSKCLMDTFCREWVQDVVSSFDWLPSLFIFFAINWIVGFN